MQFHIVSSLSVVGCNDWWNKRGPRLAILEFDRGRKSMSSIVRTEEGKSKLLVKVLYFKYPL